MSIILALHIILMSTSLIATASMAILAASSRTVNPTFLGLNIAATSAGVVAGIILIVQNPIGVKCAALFTYVIAFTATYLYVRRKNQLLSVSEA